MIVRWWKRKELTWSLKRHASCTSVTVIITPTHLSHVTLSPHQLTTSVDNTTVMTTTTAATATMPTMTITDGHNRQGRDEGSRSVRFEPLEVSFFFFYVFFFTYYSNGYIHVDFISIHPSSTSSPLTSYKQPRPPLPSHLVASICQRKSVSGAWRHDMSRAQGKFFYLFFLPFANYYNSHM